MSKHKNSTDAVMENGDVQMETISSDNQAGDTPVTETGTPASEDRNLQLEQELQEALRAKDEYYNRMLRIQADFDNFRRRSRQEYEQVCLCAGEDIIKKMLPVVDSLERAISCFTENNESCSWQEGVQLTLRQFIEILKSEGVEPVDSVNQAFDPLVHEAVFQEESETVETPMVVAEMQKGYKYKNKLLRPALVKVAVPKS